MMQGQNENPNVEFGIAVHAMLINQSFNFVANAKSRHIVM
jgi:hypothetical protein